MSFSNNNHEPHSLPMEIDVYDSNKLLDTNSGICLLDIREPVEVQTAQINGSRHIPMMEIPMRLTDLEKDQHTIVYCHHGARSLHVTAFLRKHGFNKVQSMRGGINAWSLEIDPEMPRY